MAETLAPTYGAGKGAHCQDFLAVPGSFAVSDFPLPLP